MPSSFDQKARSMNEAKEMLVTKPQVTEQTSLREIAILFLRLGTTAFGGPGGVDGIDDGRDQPPLPFPQEPRQANQPLRKLGRANGPS
jgi:hypothetical protein